MASLINADHQDKRLFRVRLMIAALLVLVLLGLLVTRMVWLQVTHHDKYQELADGNRIHVEPIVPTRGRILDRNGLVLADNQTVYTLELIRERLPRPRSAARVEALLREIQAWVPSLDERTISRMSQQWKRMRRHQPYTLLRISEEEAARFATVSWQYPGIALNATAQRLYPHGSRASHVIGYVGRITVEDLQTLDSENYRNTEFVGKRGIEQSHEAELHGRAGLRYVEVDAKGRQIRELDRIAPESGKDLVLSLDLELQTFAENLLGDRKGAIVAIDPRNGEVLALASMPTYDPNGFVSGLDNDSYQQLVNDPKKPLLNRAVQSRYPPGSTIKPLIGLIGLESGVIRADTRRFAGPTFEYKGMTFRDWKKGGHGMVDMNKAIAQSCDVYFYELALDMTISSIDAGLKPFGIGEKTGIDLDSEATGVRPSPEWKRKTKGIGWFPGETINTGIGQGYMLTTPLQLAHSTALLAMKGKGHRPHLVQQNTDTALPPIVAKEAHWKTIIDAMIEVMHGPTGTARRAGELVRTTMAGKTGTAQVYTLSRDAEYDASKIPEHLRDHALFVGFAPAHDPRIAVAVMVENGGSGGGNAAPLGALVTDFWLRKIQREAP